MLLPRAPRCAASTGCLSLTRAGMSQHDPAALKAEMEKLAAATVKKSKLIEVTRARLRQLAVPVSHTYPTARPELCVCSFPTGCVALATLGARMDCNSTCVRGARQLPELKFELKDAPRLAESDYDADELR